MFPLKITASFSPSIQITSNPVSYRISLLKQSKIFYEEVSNLPLLYTDLGKNFFEWLSSIFGDSPLLKLSADETSYVIDFVKDGFGYAFVTKSSVKRELLSGELIQVKIENSLPPKRQIYMIINKSRKDSIAITNFLEIVQN